MLRQNRKVLDAEEIALIVLMTILSICGIFFNSIVLIVYRKKRSQNAYMYLLFYLAIVDFSVSLLVIPLTLLKHLSYFRNILLLCRIYFFLCYSAPSLSVCILGLVTIERYHTITTRALVLVRNVQVIFIKYCRIAVIIALVVCFSYGFGCFFVFKVYEVSHECNGSDVSISEKAYNYCGMIILVIILFISFFLYIKIYIAVKQSQMRVSDQTGNKTNGRKIKDCSDETFNAVKFNESSNINSIMKEKNYSDADNFNGKRKKVDFLTGNCVQSSNLTNVTSIDQIPISTKDTFSSRLAKFYSKLFVTKPKTSALPSQKIITVSKNNDYNMHNRHRLEIHKDWKVAKIVALVSYELNFKF